METKVTPEDVARLAQEIFPGVEIETDPPDVNGRWRVKTELLSRKRQTLIQEETAVVVRGSKAADVQAWAYGLAARGVEESVCNTLPELRAFFKACRAKLSENIKRLLEGVLGPVRILLVDIEFERQTLHLAASPYPPNRVSVKALLDGYDKQLKYPLLSARKKGE